MNLGPPELLIIFFILLLLFGAARLPKLARSLGQATRELRRGSAEDTEDTENAEGTENTPAAEASAGQRPLDRS